MRNTLTILFFYNILQALSVDEDISVPPSVVDTSTLKHYAEEAEVCVNVLAYPARSEVRRQHPIAADMTRVL